MGRGKLVGKIFGMALVFVLVGAMLGKTASAIIRKRWRKQLESFKLTESSHFLYAPMWKFGKRT